ncbi:rhomboid family intramembrane serine protease [Pseudomonas sp. ABC1]|uniref:rhomboid family intramembrane serine protease n=1 Tax=Pseudomonas sp. ABC1 TaxID=2748080 RepID=UPI0015C2E34C|nr:rhomboid family intramembrane serine protease [Pseudomonas sp. ABC1]QLF92265.1 rhomboid family intramembrane serine protease [Pseudomonas sp. ABC1]
MSQDRRDELLEALRLPLSEDLNGFVMLLQRLGVPYRVSEEAGEQVLRVPESQLEPVRELYRRYPQGNGAPEMSRPDARGGFGTALLQHPLTSLVLLVTLVVAGLTQLGDNLGAVRWFNFTDFRIEGDYAYFASLGQTLSSGEWWRLLMPIFVHFGVLHLTMNGLWFWELGRRIEARQGAILLLALTLMFGLASNLAQYVFGGASIFGGLSGVLYGLLGHCWLYQKLAPNEYYRLPRGVLVLMLVWLLVCLSGLIDVLSFGAMSIANAAHVSGLLMGCLTGLLGGWLARRRIGRA